MQLSSISSAVRSQQQPVQPQAQNNSPAFAKTSSSKDEFHKGTTQKAPQFGCFGWFKRKDINARDALGRTAVARATLTGDVQKIQKLVRKGADVSIANNNGDFPLLIAARDNNVKVAQALSAGHNFDINQLKKDNRDQQLSGHENRGMTALISASVLGNTEMVDFLVRNGANVNIRENVIDKGGIFAIGGRTAIEKVRSMAMHAPRDLGLRYDRIIRLLEQHGAQPIMTAVDAIPPLS